MRSLCVLVLMASLTWEDYVHGRSINIADSQEQTAFGHLYLLDSSTGHSQRLKRRHVESPQDVRRLRLDLSSVNKVIDIDLQDGSVWDSTTNALIRHGEHEEPILLPSGPTCYFSGHISTGDGYASFSFCNGVNGIVHTNNESYVVEHVTHGTDDGIGSDADADLPSVAVKISRRDDVESAQIDDTVTARTAALDSSDEDGNYDFGKYEAPKTTKPPKVDSTTTGGQTTKATTGVRMATIETGIYINAGCVDRLKGWKINTTSQIVDWVINRWNIIRQVYRNASIKGIEIDIKIKRLEIWHQNPVYFKRAVNTSIEVEREIFCHESPEDGVDHKMMYTHKQTGDTIGSAAVGTICYSNAKCSIVKPDNILQRDVHELGHNLGLEHDEDTKNCTGPGGFMGARESNTLVFRDCYRVKLMSTMIGSSMNCLYSSSNLTGQVSTFSDGKFVPADPSLSSVIDKW